MMNDPQDIGSSNFDHQRSLADIMHYMNLNQAPIHQQQQQQQQRYNDNQRKQEQQLQALQLLQQQHHHQQQQQQMQMQQQQMNMSPINQLLQQQIMNRFNQLNMVNLRHHQQQQQQSMNNVNSLDHAAKYHRSSAALYDPSCTWSGVLPPRAHRFITYSPKVFLGGIPWDISEQTLMQIFKPFGQIKVEWPGKEQNAAQPKGYVYVIFESEKQVKALLQACNIQDHFENSYANQNGVDQMDTNSTNYAGTNGNYYYKISSKRIKEKEVEVIPWIIGDSNYIKSANQKIESTKTVFVGALHGKTTAEGLAKIMNDLFDGVIYAGE